MMHIQRNSMEEQYVPYKRACSSVLTVLYSAYFWHQARNT